MGKAIGPKPNRKGQQVWLAPTAGGNKVRLVDGRQVDVTELVNHSIKVTLQKMYEDAVVGKFVLASSEGEELTPFITSLKDAIVEKLTALTGKAHSDIGDGRKTITTSGTRERLKSSSKCVDYVIITAETNNTGVITVGGKSVVAAVATRQGTPLNAGDSISLGGVDLASIYLDTTVNGDGVTYLYLA